MENKEDKELRIKKQIILVLMSLSVIIFIIIYNKLKLSNNSDSYENRSKEIESTSNYKPKVETKICKVCYKTYTGSGYEAFGEEFCSLKCYVDK